MGIDSLGNEFREQFAYSDIRLWRSYGGFGSYFSDNTHVLADDYWGELRLMANCFGYLPEDIDGLRQLGFTPDEVEEFLYCDSDDFANEYRHDYL